MKTSELPLKRMFNDEDGVEEGVGLPDNLVLGAIASLVEKLASSLVAPSLSCTLH